MLSLEFIVTNPALAFAGTVPEITSPKPVNGEVIKPVIPLSTEVVKFTGK